MDRITITLDENGHVVRICADAEVEVYLVSPHVPRDRVYQGGLAADGPRGRRRGDRPLGPSATGVTGPGGADEPARTQAKHAKGA